MVILLILLILLLCALFLTFPTLRRGRCARWKRQLLAHRGLHDRDHGVVENTLPAFEAACAKGYGMELDIQFTSDMQVVVFHDNELKRLCGDPRRVDEVPLKELQDIPLLGLAEARVPTLRAVLDAVGGQTPLLIELKTGRHNKALCEALMAHLRDYQGEVLVESFDPFIVAWFRFHAPQLVRGQLVSPYSDYRGHMGALPSFCLSHLLFNFLARPDFVAYDANAARFPPIRLQRLYRTPLAAWTVHSDALARQVLEAGEICIFEHCAPDRG